jgi:hypothetical protein
MENEETLFIKLNNSKWKFSVIEKNETIIIRIIDILKNLNIYYEGVYSMNDIGLNNNNFTRIKEIKDYLENKIKQQDYFVYNDNKGDLHLSIGEGKEQNEFILFIKRGTIECNKQSDFSQHKLINKLKNINDKKNEKKKNSINPSNKNLLDSTFNTQIFAYINTNLFILISLFLCLLFSILIYYEISNSNQIKENKILLEKILNKLNK